MNYDIPGWTTVEVEHFGNLTRVTYQKGDQVKLANGIGVTKETLAEFLKSVEAELNG